MGNDARRRKGGCRTGYILWGKCAGVFLPRRNGNLQVIRSANDPSRSEIKGVTNIFIERRFLSYSRSRVIQEAITNEIQIPKPKPKAQLTTKPKPTKPKTKIQIRTNPTPKPIIYSFPVFRDQNSTQASSKFPSSERRAPCATFVPSLTVSRFRSNVRARTTIVPFTSNTLGIIV
jgi:hypothetical protein